MTQQDTMALYQEFLDHMGAALMAQDASAFLRHVFLPHVIETGTATILIEDRETAERHFAGFCQSLAAQNVDAYTRVARHAAFEGPDRLRVQHDTYITSRGKLVTPVFRNEINLERRGGLWGSRGTRHHARYISWPDLLPRAEAP